MSQHDYVIDNSDGLTVRNDINSALGAIQSMNSGTTSPTATIAFQFWADTTSGLLKQRNSADSAWINKWTLATTLANFTAALETKLNGIQALAEVNPAVVPQAEAEAGIATTERIWTALRVKQAIAALETGGGGKVLQVKNLMDGAVATGSTDIPFDNTIPTSSEGDQFMSLAITAASTSNFLIIEVVFNYAIASGSERMAIALFRDALTPAIAVAVDTADIAIANIEGQIVLRHYMAVPSTSALTFKVRAGPAAGGGTVTFNGNNAIRLFGGVMASSITITEIRA